GAAPAAAPFRDAASRRRRPAAPAGSGAAGGHTRAAAIRPGRNRSRPRPGQRRAALLLWAGTEDAPVAGGDAQVVDARLAAAHQPVGGELPQLVAVAAPPPAAGVPALVLEPDRDTVLPEGPQLLAERVVEFALPLGGQERLDLRSAAEEPVPVAPERVGRVSAGDERRVAGVPGVLGGLDLRAGGGLVERRHGRAGHGAPQGRGGLPEPVGAAAPAVPEPDGNECAAGRAERAMSRRDTHPTVRDTPRLPSGPVGVPPRGRPRCPEPPIRPMTRTGPSDGASGGTVPRSAARSRPQRPAPTPDP